ncbi:putative nuclear RNA export factor SDE5 isoform X3 [Arachis duranensis]|uniref:Nuclear RNA export factor SDE5 isoform X3 n=1 Tax=Arachis duranensis TaxID=130453 RepID=A0A9C6T857_ARADU|nr:putative nuclear RNA export factor SDE5 isoform X3 [Arachis duranensis]
MLSAWFSISFCLLRFSITVAGEKNILKMPPYSDAEERDLSVLLESFGSLFSLEDIASAYCEAKRNVNMAAEILCASSNSDELKGTISEPAKVSSASEFPNSLHGERNSGAVKSKPHRVSLGTVSGVVGKEYIHPKKMPTQGVKSKPSKIDAKELPESEIWSERDSLKIEAAKGSMRDDVVNFLFQMLGDGFELDKDKIHDVLGLCGYDVKKVHVILPICILDNLTMEELLDMSASTLEKGDDDHGLAGENLKDQHPDVSSESSEKECNSIDKVGLQKEILGSLFSFPQRSEEQPKHRLPVRSTPYRYGRRVVRIPEDTPKVQQSTTVVPQVIKEESDEDENSYNVLRRAVRENWATMKEYYSAAVDAFAKGDYARADRLMEQGHFYNRMAREADEKSAQKLLQSSESNDDAIPLDLSEHEPKEALRLVKFHLTTLSGIHSIKYLKVIVGTGDEDKKGTRKKLKIIKQLSTNSIQWTEEDNGRILRLKVDEIDRSSKKSDTS